MIDGVECSSQVEQAQRPSSELFLLKASDRSRNVKFLVIISVVFDEFN